MIVFDEKRNINIEFPDDMTDQEIQDAVTNFTPPEDAAVEDRSKQYGELTQYQPSFFDDHIKPVLLGMGADPQTLQNTENWIRFGKTAPSPYINPATKSESPVDAFASKFFEEMSFGIYNADEYKTAQKAHPVMSFLGQLAGGIGSFITTGGILKTAGVAKLAADAGMVASEYAAPALRYVPRMIFDGATFGTRALITSTVKQAEERKFDIGELGKTVLKDTGLGIALGGIGGMQNWSASVSAAAGLGYLSAKMDGQDNASAALGGLMWAGFEMIAGAGKDKRLIKETFEAIKRTAGDIAMKYAPAEYNMTKEMAYKIGSAWLEKEAAAYGGVDKIVNATDRAKALKLLEQMNQRMRKAMRAVPKMEEPVKAKGPAIEEPQPAAEAPKTPETPAEQPPAETVVPQGTQPGSEVIKPPVMIEGPKKIDVANLKFETGGDALGKEYHGYFRAVDPESGKQVGYVDYSYYQGKMAVKMIEVDPEYRRQGVGLALLNKLQSESKTPIEIQGDFATKEGQALFEKFKNQPAPVPDQAGKVVDQFESGHRIVMGVGDTFEVYSSKGKKIAGPFIKVEDAYAVVEKKIGKEVFEEHKYKKLYGKQPWEMTKSEFMAGNFSETRQMFHQKAIEKALAKGKPVPESVLKDYPELWIPFEPTQIKSATGNKGTYSPTNPNINASTATVSIDQMAPASTPKKFADFKLFEETKKLLTKYVKNWGETWNPKPKTVGAFYTESKNVFLDALNDIGVAVHETTHSVDDELGITVKLMATTGESVTGNPIYDSRTFKLRQEFSKVYVKYYPTGKMDHDLEKKITEGLATFIQKMIEDPDKIKAEFPNLYKALLERDGEFYHPTLKELFEDARKIVEEYQALDDIHKIGARIVSDTNVSGRETFLSPKEKMVQEFFDNVSPLEKLAAESGLAGTGDDPSLIVRVYNQMSSIINHNVASNDGYVTIVNGELKKVFDFNWKTLIDKVKKSGKANLFNAFLVARRIHFTFELIDENKRTIEGLKERIRKIADEISNDPKWAEVDNADEAIEKAIRKATSLERAGIKNLTAENARLEAILRNDAIDRTIATNTYSDWRDEFKTESEMFDKLTRADLDLLASEDVQLIKPEMRNKLVKTEGYATFKRDLVNQVLGDQETITGRTPGGVKSSTMKARTGSQRAIIEPLYAQPRAHAEIVRKALKQMVYNKMIPVAKAHPALFQIVPVVRKPEPDGSISYPQEKDPVIIMARDGYKRVPIKTNAEVKNIIDELLDYKSVHTIEKIMRIFSRWFTKGTTGNYPLFAIQNIVVDQFTAAAQTKNEYRPILDQIQIIRAMLDTQGSDEAQYLKEYFILGGERQTLAGWQDMSPNEFYDFVTKERTGLLKFVDWMDKGMNILSFPAKISEILTRATEYIKARKAGKHQFVALEEAGRVSAPFHHIGRWGGGTVGQSWVKSIPYFNSSFQVLGQFAKTLEDPETRERAFFVIGVITAAYIAGMLANYAFGSKEQKDAYEGLQPQELSSYIFFPLPNGKGLFRARVPEQFAIIGVVMNMIIGNFLSKSGYQAKEFIDAGTAWVPDQINVTDPARMFMSWWPHIIRPVADVLTNTRTYPKVLPIETQADKNLEAQFRKNENTSAFASWLGERLKISPKMVDHLIQGYMGRTSKFITGGKIHNPVVREVYFTASRQLNNYYEMKEKNDQLVNSYRNKRREFSLEEKQRMMREYKILLPIEKALEIYRKMEKSNQNDPRLADARRRILDMIDSL